MGRGGCLVEGEKDGEGSQQYGRAEGMGCWASEGDMLWFVDSPSLARRRCHATVGSLYRLRRRPDTGQGTRVFV